MREEPGPGFFFYPADIQIFVHLLLFILLQTPGMLAGAHPAASLEEGFEPKAVCYPHIWTFWDAQSSSAAAFPLQFLQRSFQSCWVGYKGDTKSTSVLTWNSLVHRALC